MGWRFRKSIKIAPGVKLNFGKKSAGISFGNKGGGISFNSKTGARVRASIPGTGLSYSSKLFGGKKKKARKRKVSSPRKTTVRKKSAVTKPKAATLTPEEKQNQTIGSLIIMGGLIALYGVWYAFTHWGLWITISAVVLVIAVFVYTRLHASHGVEIEPEMPDTDGEAETREAETLESPEESPDSEQD